jgi:hypothetical protein
LQIKINTKSLKITRYSTQLIKPKNLTLVIFSFVTLILYFVCGAYPDAVTVILCKPDNNKRQ